MTSPDTGLRLLLTALQRLAVPYMVCGSLASSIHGVVRATRDIDLVADLRPEQIDPLVAALGADFYADAAMIRQSLQTGRPFNLIHYSSSYKFDLFPLSPDRYDQLQFERRKPQTTRQFGEQVEIPVATAEDTVLMKLAWYRAGGEVSERQWNDVRGVIEIQRERLDLAYLRQWAAHLGVKDLLDAALQQCRLG